jgi:nucleobindin
MKVRSHKDRLTCQSLTALIQLLEQYHSTPETQEPSAYNHVEDLEHFSHHDAIEFQEAEREAIFQGISVEEALAQHAEPAPSEEPPADQAKVDEPEVSKKFERQIPPEQQDPAIRFRKAKAESEAHGEWGAGESGYKAPNTPSEKMRKNLPYKVKCFFVRAELLSEIDTGTYAVQVPPKLG